MDAPGALPGRSRPDGHGTVGGWRMPSEPPATAGHGIIGMRERAHLCGGKFSARPLRRGRVPGHRQPAADRLVPRAETIA